MLTDIGSTPVVQTGGGNGFGEGGGIWAFLLLALLGGNGFGGWGDRNGVANVDNTVWAAQQYSQIDNGIRGIGQGLCDTTFSLNNSIKDGTYATTMAINDAKYQLGNGLCSTTFELSRAISDCCCSTNRNIDSVNYNNAINTNTIVQAGNANTQRILDFLACAELKEANAKIAEQGQLLSEARIIAAMKPQAPIPAYTVPSPYGQFCC